MAEGLPQRLQLLAEALAAEFSQSQASAACATAVSRLLPGVEYLSVALSNPAQGGAIVALTNCVAEGPTTLHLHDPLSSAAGRALALGKPLQTSLLNGAGTAVLPAWTDVQLMVTHAPAVTHLLCIPFGCGEDAASDSRCQHLQQGSGSGALLFGFSAPPQLDARRKAMLGMLVQCLPAPMARLSADTLAFVNFACGSNSQCSCCCSADEEEEVGTPRGPCREHDRGDGSSGGTVPSQALHVPHAGLAHAPALEPEDSAGSSSSQVHYDVPEDEEGCSKAAAAARAEAVSTPPPAADAAASRGSSSGSASMSPRFSKSLVAAAAEEGEMLMAQSQLTLTFLSAEVEREYAAWSARRHLKSDALFSLLFLGTLTSAACVRLQPYRIFEHMPGTLALSLGVLLPLLLRWLGSQITFICWREMLMSLFRLYAVALISLLYLQSYQVQSYQARASTERVQQWVTFWKLTGVEGLFITAVGFRTRLRVHMLVQGAALLLVLSTIPHVCKQSLPRVLTPACIKGNAAAAVWLGFILPTAGLRYVEQRSRSAFARHLRAPAARER